GLHINNSYATIFTRVPLNPFCKSGSSSENFPGVGYEP
ncbi:unnamed protein product, partial [Allacma fusca]